MSRLIHQTNKNPGPGQYGPDTTTQNKVIDSNRSITYDSKTGISVKPAPGRSFGKSGLTRDNSGLRELSTLPFNTSQQSKLIT